MSRIYIQVLRLSRRAKLLNIITQTTIQSLVHSTSPLKILVSKLVIISHSCLTERRRSSCCIHKCHNHIKLMKVYCCHDDALSSCCMLGCSRYIPVPWCIVYLSVSLYCMLSWCSRIVWERKCLALLVCHGCSNRWCHCLLGLECCYPYHEVFKKVCRAERHW